MTVRTRIAPSPTGDPHVGTGYMGLVNMVHARQHGGQFILRIDDTDRTRFRAGSEQAIFDSLRWMGIEWDEGPDKGGPHGPYRQSERTEIYHEHGRMLLETEHAYRCFCTKERLAALKQEQAAAKVSKQGYDGTCRDLDPAEVETLLAAGTPHVVRLRVPLEGESVIQDLLRGELRRAYSDLQDQVLIKEDGFPTYHLASCIDDHLMGITHIVRAEEWISSAAIHELIFKAYGWDMPVLCHMPLLRNADKSKISKRKNPTSLLYYREAGYLPEGLLNFLGLMGWGGPKLEDDTNQEIFTVAEMTEHFKLDQIKLGGPVFDVEKLDYVNGQHMRRLSVDAYRQRVADYLFGDAARFEAICAQAQPRTERLGQFLDVAGFFLGDVSHVHPDDRKQKDPKQRRPVEGLVPKDVEPSEAWFVLSDCMGALDQVDDWTPEALEPACRALAGDEATGWKVRDLFMTLRVALAGKKESPPLFDTMQILGKPRCLGRLGDAMRALPEPSKKAQKKREKQQRKG